MDLDYFIDRRTSKDHRQPLILFIGFKGSKFLAGVARDSLG